MEANIKCDAKQYNFKKGMEYCENKHKCMAHRRYFEELEKGKHNYEIETIRFNFIKEFRKCENYKETDLRLHDKCEHLKSHTHRDGFRHCDFCNEIIPDNKV